MYITVDVGTQMCIATLSFLWISVVCPLICLLGRLWLLLPLSRQRPRPDGLTPRLLFYFTAHLGVADPGEDAAKDHVGWDIGSGAKVTRWFQYQLCSKGGSHKVIHMDRPQIWLPSKIHKHSHYLIGNIRLHYAGMLTRCLYHAAILGYGGYQTIPIACKNLGIQQCIKPGRWPETCGMSWNSQVKNPPETGKKCYWPG